MHFHIISLFPESIEPYLSSSILKRAQEDKKIKITYYNPRDFTDDRLKRIDQKPYGGGPGMVIQAEPVVQAIQKAKGAKKNVQIIWFTPGGEQFDTQLAQVFEKKYKHLILVCGRYEGIDARVKEVFGKEIIEISVGPFVTTGGEVPAMIVVDVVARQIKGVLGNFSSREESRIASHDVYTRPEVFTYKKKHYSVPKVLLSGHHAEIDKHRKKRQSK